MADLPLDLVPALAERLTGVLDREGKIPRALAALGPVADRDVVVIDAAGGLRACQLGELGARLTLVERDAEHMAAVRGAAQQLGARVVEGSAGATALPDASADVVVACWSAFRADQAAELAEADRVLRPDGRLLVLHDYGRDDVSRLRPADLPEYGAWSRRDGWFLASGFKVRVLHCWWTFESIEAGRDFLVDAFGAVGDEVGSAMRRPRLSYNVAIYHRGRNGAPPPSDT